MNIIKLSNDDANFVESFDTSLYNSVFRGRYCYVVDRIESSDGAELNKDTRLYPMKPSNDGTVYIKVQIGDTYSYKKLKEAPVGVIIPEVFIVKKDPTAEDPIYIRLIVPGLLRDDYISIVLGEKNIDEFPDALYLTYKDVKTKIDKSDSELYLNTSYYEKRNHTLNDLNKYDIDIDTLRAYRTSVAFTILRGMSRDEYRVLDLCPREISMLKYYVEDMNDTVIESIRLVKKDSDNQSTLISTPSSTCSCSAQAGNGLSTINISSLSCDLEREYRDMMKKLMIKIFSDINFWNKISLKYKKGLDDIIDLTRGLLESGLSPFDRAQKMDLNYCCRDVSDSDKLLDNYRKDLENIIEAFELILKEDDSRPSFINFQLRRFANMYEYLQWTGEEVIALTPNCSFWQEYI